MHATAILTTAHARAMAISLPPIPLASPLQSPRAIDVHIRHLREKLEEQPEDPSLILTVRGAGYRFREQ